MKSKEYSQIKMNPNYMICPYTAFHFIINNRTPPMLTVSLYTMSVMPSSTQSLSLVLNL